MDLRLDQALEALLLAAREVPTRCFRPSKSVAFQGTGIWHFHDALRVGADPNPPGSVEAMSGYFDRNCC